MAQLQEQIAPSVARCACSQRLVRRARRALWRRRSRPWRARCPGRRNVRRAVRRATRACLEQRAFCVRHSDDQHAVMQQRQHHAEQSGLLAAVQGRGGGEYAGRLVDEGSRHPQLARGIEEILEGCRHVAETRWAADEQAVGFGEIGDLRVGGPSVGIDGSTASLVAETGGTVRKRAVAPALSTPRAAARASAAVLPPRE